MTVRPISRASLTVLSLDRKSTRLNSSHLVISYAVFCLKKKNNHKILMSQLVSFEYELPGPATPALIPTTTPPPSSTQLIYQLFDAEHSPVYPGTTQLVA